MNTVTTILKAVHEADVNNTINKLMAEQASAVINTDEMTIVISKQWSVSEKYLVSRSVCAAFVESKDSRIVNIKGMVLIN